jgi:hypothetical protein
MFNNTFLNAPVTLYRGVTDTIGEPCTVADFINRRALDYEAGDMKRRLPCITVGGRFNRRKLVALLEPSGVIQLDIDLKDNPFVTDWREVVETLAITGGIEVFSAVSASGKGAFALYYLPNLLEVYRTEGAAAYLDAHRWQTHEMAQTLYYESGLIADSSCINRPNGLRFITADQGAILKAKPATERLELLDVA